MMYATIQVDLDGIWTIYQHHHIEVSHVDDSVFEQSISRFITLFQQTQIQSTFFVVGSDIENPSNETYLNQIVHAGHELANHTYSHPLNFSRLSFIEKKLEIEKADHLIQKVIQEPVSGFRAPSYAIDRDILNILENMNYRYDSSILPTYWSSMIRLIESGFSIRRSKQTASYGKIQYGRGLLRTYHPDMAFPWKEGNSNIWEVPISVYPLIRTPIHSSFSSRVGWWYFASAIKWLSRLQIPVVFLFHGVDLVDQFVDRRIPRLKWVDSPVEHRIAKFQRMLQWITQNYQVIPTKELVKRI